MTHQVGICWYSRRGCGLGIAGKTGREMRIKARGVSESGSCETPPSSSRRWGAIARRSAILLGGTAVLVLSITQPANAISINDPVANAVNGVTNYWDSTN